jgi:CBS domain containing-hemolysin-like protein
LPIGEYETIGGMLAYYSGRILSQGESIKISKYSFYVVKAAPKRVELCKIAILDEL